MILYLMLALCVFILMAMIHRYDMHHREPWYMALLAVVLGAAGYWGISSTNDWVLLKLGVYDPLSVALVAGIGEEVVKLAMVLMIASCLGVHFDDPMDGIVYGAYVGIGFALAESVFYIPFTQQTMPHVSQADLFGQEAVRSVLHFLTGAMGGFGVGLARCRVPSWRYMLPSWWLASVAIHFGWDYACGLTHADDARGIFMQRSAAICLMIVAMVLFRTAVWVANSWCQANCPPGSHDETSR